MTEGYQKYQEGFGNVRRVSEMRRGYLICMKGIEKLEKRNTGFSKVSEIFGGYRKYQEGIGNDGRVSEMCEGYGKILKKVTPGFNRLSEISRGYRKYQEGIGNE